MIDPVAFLWSLVHVDGTHTHMHKQFGHITGFKMVKQHSVLVAASEKR